MDDLPEDWKIPTFREIGSPVPMFGVTPEQVAATVVIAGTVGITIVVCAMIAKSAMLYLTALLLSVGIVVVMLATMRHLQKLDPHWVEHLTTHRWPATLYLGR